MKLLVIEDDEAIARKLNHELCRAGHAPTWKGCVSEGLVALRTGRHEMVLLDLMLPDGSGFDFIAESRRESRVPIIVVSARVDGSDKVRALQLGADDYITKPFWTEEVLARISAVTRRYHTAPEPQTVVRIDDAVVDLAAMTVQVGGLSAGLTPTEFDLLAYLLKNPDEALTNDRLVSRVLMDEVGIDALRVHVSRLRKKLGDAGARVKTVWGIGYRLALGEPA